MKLIEEYIELTKVCVETDYSDRKSVERMYEIAEKIRYEKTDETIDDCKLLLDIKENKTNIWAAVHTIERIPIDKTTKNKAIDLIKEIAKGNKAEAMGFSFWLDNYHKNKS